METVRPEGLQVLLVDDDGDLAFLLGRWLEREGWSITHADSCVEARRQLSDHHFDVLLTDMNLPDGDGLRLLDAGRPLSLRAALVMTGDGTVGDTESALLDSFDGWIAKPLDAHRVVHLIRERIGDNLTC